MSPRPRRLRTPVMAIAAAAVLSGASAASAAAPPAGVTVAPAGPSTVATRTLSWTPVPPDIDGNDVIYEGGVTTSPAPPGAPASFGAGSSASLAVPEGDLYFHVRSVERFLGIPIVYSDFVTSGPHVSDRTRPTVTITQSPVPNPRAWTNAPTTVSFACADANPGGPGWCPAPVLVGEGAGRLVSGTATDALGQTRTVSTTVNVDLTAPVAAQPATPAAGATVTTTRPEFTWAAAADPLSGIQYYEVHVVGRGKVGSTNPDRTRLVSTQTLSAGTVQWYVRAVDRANNAVESPRMTLTIDPTAGSQSPDPPAAGQPGGSSSSAGAPAPPPAAVVRPPAAGGQVARPVSFNARALHPRAGARINSLRPVLRWTRGPRGTRLYNVQVFEIRGRKVRKVVTAFPRGTRYRVPAGKLRRDRRYVWRVWPHIARRGYSAKPVGVSFFDVRARRPAASSATPPGPA